MAEAKPGATWALKRFASPVGGRPTWQVLVFAAPETGPALRYLCGRSYCLMRLAQTSIAVGCAGSR